MVRRRLAFAAPFVLVIGCRTPPPVEPGEEQTEEEEEAPVVVNAGPPSDAAVATVPVDAVVATAPVDAVVAVAPVDAGPPKVVERPRDRSILGEGNPPPPTIRGYLLESRAVQDGATEVTFDAGLDRGVDPKRATARLLEGETAQPLRGGEITLANCTKRTCRGTVKLGPDQVSRNPNVEIRKRDPNAPPPERPPITCCVNAPRGKKPKPPEPDVPRKVRILNTQVEGGVTTIIIGVGTDQGVTVVSSDVQVSRGDGTPIPSGEVTLTECTARMCRGTVKLTPDQIKVTPEVMIRRKDQAAP